MNLTEHKVNLTEHKARIDRYEALLLEIRALTMAKDKQYSFSIAVNVHLDGVGSYETEVPVPKDYALKQLQHLLGSLLVQAHDEAQRLGFDAERLR